MRVYNDNDKQDIVKLFAKICVYSRFAQHIAWEMQYAINGLADFGIAVPKISDYKSRLFEVSHNIGREVPGALDRSIDHFDLLNIYSKHPLTQVFDDATMRLDDMDSLVEQETMRLLDSYGIHSDEDPCDGVSVTFNTGNEEVNTVEQFGEN